MGDQKGIRAMADDILGDGRKAAPKRTLDHIEIEPADSVTTDDGGRARKSRGAVVTAHIREETGEKGEPTRYHHKRHVFERASDAADHVERILDSGDLP